MNHQKRGSAFTARLGLAAALSMGSLALADTAHADSANFELSGKIYTKWLYKNDATRGCLSLSNPFWPDNIGGGNGVCSEFELNIKGRVSKYVTTGVRIKSRFGALWQTWWENGDTRWDFPNNTLFREDTSGESIGLNHAQYMKLRGAFIRANLPIPSVRFVHFGASDFSSFNEWTIGKLRYIDRDNGNGVFAEGAIHDQYFRYHGGALALPKLFVGPRWNTGLRDADPLAGFWGQDWGYVLKLESSPIDDLEIVAIGSYIHDWEADRNDPDLTGSADRDRGADHSVDLAPRFRAANATLEGKYNPASFDVMSINGLLAFAHNSPNPEYATNCVENDQGFCPVLFLEDEDGNPKAANAFAGKVLVEFFDPFDIGLSLKAEYFNIGSRYNANFGARRESDVLLTEGLITSGWIDGGQLPTLNLANEFVDFDEPWFESIIGWHGATGLLEYVNGPFNASGEYTLITYNTNAQDLDVDRQYPDFLYTDGFTDPQAFTADFDYANIFDRGADPRSVYAEYKERLTHIAILNAEYLMPFGNNFVVEGKLKYVNDADNRRKGNPDDNYRGQLYLGWANLKYQWTDELQTGLGYEYQWWDEEQRSGSQQTGFFDYDTKKHTARLTARYNFGGLSVSYLLEYFNKAQDRDRPGTFDQRWNVWRSKATVEAAW